VWVYMLLGVFSLVGVFVANFSRVRHQTKGRGRERVRSKTPARTEEAVRLVNVKVEKPGITGGRRATLDIEGGAKRGRRLSAAGEAESLDERVGEGFINGMANSGLISERAQTQFLPAPAHDHREPAFSWMFGNKRQRVSIPFMYFFGCACRKRRGRWVGRGHGGLRDGERKGLVIGFMSDVSSVAWPPVLLFVVIALWMFR